MSSNYWQTQKQTMPSGCGKGVTLRVSVYLSRWKSRCYVDIPDEVPKKLAQSGRAPSYKAIAIAILKNDLQLKSLGFADDPPEIYWQVKRLSSDQRDLFG